MELYTSNRSNRQNKTCTFVTWDLTRNNHANTITTKNLSGCSTPNVPHVRHEIESYTKRFGVGGATTVQNSCLRVSLGCWLRPCFQPYPRPHQKRNTYPTATSGTNTKRSINVRSKAQPPLPVPSVAGTEIMSPQLCGSLRQVHYRQARRLANDSKVTRQRNKTGSASWPTETKSTP